MALKKKSILAILAAGWLVCMAAWATSVSVMGLFKDKAIVDGMVVESGLDVPLLGMSFLNRMEMKRDGQTMTLTQRY